MKLSEPATTLTDYLLSLETYFFAALLIFQGITNLQHSVLFWGVAFAAIATAAFTGGTFHGFHDMNPAYRAALWKLTVFSIGLSCLLMLTGTIFASVLSMRFWLLAIVLFNFLIFTGWMIFRSDYKYVVYNSLIAMFGVLLMLLLRHPPGSGWILIAVLVSFAAAGIQRSGLSLHKHFNNNDLYHVIQMGAMYLFYKGAMLLQDVS